MEVCPQCETNVNESSNRIVQDSCGHKKCRKCLLNDEDVCKMCISQIGVIKYECDKNNHKETTNTIPYSEDEQSCSTKKAQNGKTQKRAYHHLELPSHIVMMSENNYKCSICSKEFTTKSHIKFHKFCTGAKKPYCCEICRKEFVAKSHYESHKLIHLEVKPYNCDICEKGFTQMSKLNRHKLLHSNIRSFTCQECGKSFRSKDYLKTHSIIHKNDKPYACTQCKAKFNNSSNLKKHLTTHSAEKEHMCDQCGKRFKSKWALTVHRRSHTGQRPHECQHCGKAFINLKDLQRHKLIHTDGTSFACGICMTSFKRKDNLDRHIQNSHPGKKVSPIKKKLDKPTEQPHTNVVDNPNAINVITSSISQKAKKEEKPIKQINAPLKLAFKTSAFKNCYNIHRDVEPQTDQINIYQKILLPHSTTKVEKEPAKEETEEVPRIHFPPPTLHYETSFEHKTHAIIKNIKFKLPSKYTNLKTEMSKALYDNLPVINRSEFKPPETNTTSVIVNTPINENYLRKKSIK